jgi:murein L,D-transpeptidase YafK
MISFGKLRFLALAATLVVLGGCMGNDSGAKHLRPLSYATKAELRAKDMRESDPLLVRIFKEENELEVWKKRRDGRFAHFRTYEICAWSGELGPKHREGDRQTPEGFYTVTPAQMNPNSSYHLSFNIGFPNTFDRAHGRTGSHIMVHGACSSAGCYAMTDEVIEEIYALAREAFRGGQREFQVQAYPFRMTPENMARHADNPNMPFWRTLKEGNDHFKVTGRAPEVAVCGRNYVFNATAANGERLYPNAACPPLEVPAEIEAAVAAKQMRDETAFQVALADIRARQQQDAPAMTPALMVAYDDITEEGSTAEGYEGEIAEAGASFGVSTGASAFRPVNEAFSGFWNRIVDLTRPDRMDQGSAMDEDLPTADEASAVQPEGAGTSATHLPARMSASAFAPHGYERDIFSVFSLFETVDGASVPADTVRR